MSDTPTAAPATSAPASNGTSAAEIPLAGTQAPRAAPKPTLAARPGTTTPPTGDRPRLNDGRFAPKEGNVAQEELGLEEAGEATPAEVEAKKEEYRFKRKLKVFGQEEELDLSEDEIAQRLQRGRMYEKKEADLRKSQKEATAELDRIYRALKENPAEVLRQLGHDPQALARRQLAEQARLGAMDEHERAIFDRDQKLAEYEAREKQQADAEKEFRQRAARQYVNKQHEKLFLGALEMAGVPKSAEGLRMVLETHAAMREEFGDGVEFAPEELAQETSRRLDEYTERYLNTLDGKGLRKKLGPARIKAILKAELDDLAASQPYDAPPTTQAEESRAAEPEGYISFDDVRERLRRA